MSFYQKSERENSHLENYMYESDDSKHFFSGMAYMYFTQKDKG